MVSSLILVLLKKYVNVVRSSMKNMRAIDLVDDGYYWWIRENHDAEIVKVVLDPFGVAMGVTGSNGYSEGDRTSFEGELQGPLIRERYSGVNPTNVRLKCIQTDVGSVVGLGEAEGTDSTFLYFKNSDGLETKICISPSAKIALLDLLLHNISPNWSQVSESVDSTQST